MPHRESPLIRMRDRLARWLLVAAVAVAGAGTLLPAAGAQPATPAAAPAVGLTRAAPAPLGDAVDAGPVTLQVQQVLIGPDAVGAVLAASPQNLEPRDGATYVAVEILARNTGTQPISLNNDDFALTGDAGFVRRFLGAQPPAPALDVTLAPGESAAGWVAFAAGVEEGSLLLIFDSLQIGGAWADRVLALQEGAGIDDLPRPVAAANDAGRDVGAALAGGEAAITDQWSVTLLEVVSGAPAFDIVDYRSGALGPGDASGEDGSIWVALHFEIQNVGAGGAAAFFPANAFVLADEAGNPLLDIATLTPPYPDAAGGYYPGATRDGWVMFDVPVDYGAALVRFLPYAHTTQTPDARYFSFR